MPGAVEEMFEPVDDGQGRDVAVEAVGGVHVEHLLHDFRVIGDQVPQTRDGISGNVDCVFYAMLRRENIGFFRRKKKGCFKSGRIAAA